MKRIVMTANFGAVGFSHHDSQTSTTEQDWTDPNEPGLSPYEKSKLLAEQAAWAYVDQRHPSFEFNTVNPVAILGNSLDDHVSGSFTLIKQLIDGRSQFSVNLPLNVVNVTDVVDLHLRALFTPPRHARTVHRHRRRPNFHERNCGLDCSPPAGIGR